MKIKIINAILVFIIAIVILSLHLLIILLDLSMQSFVACSCFCGILAAFFTKYKGKLFWKFFLSKNPIIIIYDTETSGLDSNYNKILSLSWQMIDASKNFELIENKTFYFPFPDDIDRVDRKAIEINGLTKSKLEELGTTEYKDGLSLFLKSLKQANIAVGHNIEFDNEFIRNACIENKLCSSLKFPFIFDTMKDMTNFCAIPSYNHGYKYPKLCELAQILNIYSDDINFHSSSNDVQLTKRCFIRIVNKEIF